MNLTTICGVFLFAHVICDFYFQPDNWVNGKKEKGFRSKFLYFHCIVYSVVMALLVLLFTKSVGWSLATLAFVGASHLLLDGLKSKTPKECLYFFVDQLFHIVVLAFVVWMVSAKQQLFCATPLIPSKYLFIILGYSLMLKPCGIIAKVVMDSFGVKMDEKGLKRGGMVIGYIERFMLLTFIFMGYFEGIGFLLAAKSIFRFGELKEAKELQRTEYILIGTLLSFSMAIFIGMIIRQITFY